MSDSIYDWAGRELAAITLNGRPLDARHLSALAYMAVQVADEAVQDDERIAELEASLAAARSALTACREAAGKRAGR